MLAEAKIAVNMHVLQLVGQSNSNKTRKKMSCRFSQLGDLSEFHILRIGKLKLLSHVGPTCDLIKGICPDLPRFHVVLGYNLSVRSFTLKCIALELFSVGLEKPDMVSRCSMVAFSKSL
jgi:hypothetical protein